MRRTAAVILGAAALLGVLAVPASADIPRPPDSDSSSESGYSPRPHHHPHMRPSTSRPMFEFPRVTEGQMEGLNQGGTLLGEAGMSLLRFITG
jgi:hypothetical protein